MAAVAARLVDDVKPALPVSPASSSTMAANEGKPTPPSDMRLEQDVERGRRRSRPSENGDDDHEDGDGDGQRAGSSNSDGPARKRKRTRKVLDKKFDCPHEGCGKSYSRAEHLYRHQLNHNPKQIYACDYPDCSRTFVRLDLSLRHKERHSAKGSSLNRKDSLVQHSPTASERHSGMPPGSVSPEANRPGSGYPTQVRAGHLPYQSPKDHMGSPYGTPVTNTPPTGFPSGATHNGMGGYMHHETGYRPGPSQQSPNGPGPARPSIQTNVTPYGVLSPVSTQQGFHSHHTNTPQQSVSYVQQQNFPPFNLPPSNFPNESAHRESEQRFAPSTSAELGDQSQQSNDLMMLDPMQVPQQTLPVFGGDTMLNKSPYVAIPEDFVAFLFNQNSSMEGSPMGQMMGQGGYPHNYGDYPNNYSVPYMGSEGVPTGYFPAGHQVMAVASLVEQNLPEATISDEKSAEIYELVKDRFHENGQAPIERMREQILDGDRTQDDHMLSKRMMQAYIGSYWLHFSDQVPILHKPTFSPDRTPNLLLIAIITIGAACLDKKTHGTEVTKAGSELSNFLAWHLRWEIFMDPGFRPPSKLWVFQTLLLLEVYEKMFATRELHERAHIHHATTITLMRRGRSLVGKSSVDSPPSHNSDRGAGVNGSRHSSSSGVHTAEEWWNHWITNEATRRAAFAAFVIDSIHATMFGHNTVMVTHEMRLPLPCDESLWKAKNGAEVSRLDANLQSQGMKPIAFLEGLKRTLSGQEVHTNSFGRTILMAGLLSVTWHMNQRDLQIGVLGNGVSQALGGRDKWKGTLNRAFDTWKTDFDKSLHREGPTNDPYQYNVTKKTDVNVVFESRIVLHHLAHMAMHVDIIDCQIFARAKRLLGRAIGPQDLQSAQRRMKDMWAPSAKARDATYYALKFLRSVLIPDGAAGSSPRSESYNPDEPYSARDDVLLNRPWVLYFAVLVVWCYGYALEGPCPNAHIPTSASEQVRMMNEYLLKFSSASSPEDLKTLKGLNENNAMLMVLRDSFDATRWELLHEGAILLKNCLTLNAGGNAT